MHGKAMRKILMENRRHGPFQAGSLMPEWTRQIGCLFGCIESGHIPQHDLVTGNIAAHPGRIVRPHRQGHSQLQCAACLLHGQKPQIVTVAAQVAKKMLGIEHSLGEIMPFMRLHLGKRSFPGADGPNFEKSFRGESRHPVPGSDVTDHAPPSGLFGGQVIGKQQTPGQRSGRCSLT